MNKQIADIELLTTKLFNTLPDKSKKFLNLPKAELNDMLVDVLIIKIQEIKKIDKLKMIFDLAEA